MKYYSYTKRKLSHFFHSNIMKLINNLIKLEDNLNFRYDFIDIYESSISQSPLKRNFKSLPYPVLIKLSNEWAYIALNYDPHKLVIKKLDRTILFLKDFSEIPAIIGNILLFFSVLLTGSTFILLIFIQNILTWAAFGIAAIIFSLIIISKMLAIDSQVINSLNKKWVITENDIDILDKEHKKKEIVGAGFVWNHSLCNEKFISTFILLFLLKIISKRIFSGVKRGLIIITPRSISESPNKINRLSHYKLIINYLWRRK